jgi:hypothetical protein
MAASIEVFGDGDAYWDDDLLDREDYAPRPPLPYLVPVDHAVPPQTVVDRSAGGAA